MTSSRIEFSIAVVASEATRRQWIGFHPAKKELIMIDLKQLEQVEYNKNRWLINGSVANESTN